MSRFKLPPRVAPSPAAGEPGMQNAVARLRSSREAQGQLLAEQRGQIGETVEPIQASDSLTETRLPPKAEADAAPSSAPESPMGPVGSARKDKKVKVVVMFRLPKKQVGLLSGIPGAAGLSDAYVLKAFAKEGRAALRAFNSAKDLLPLVVTAKTFRATTAEDMTVAEAMTVYVQPLALRAMHVALDDPWMILPKASTVGAFLAAIIIRLIETQLAKEAPS